MDTLHRLHVFTGSVARVGLGAVVLLGPSSPVSLCLLLKAKLIRTSRAGAPTPLAAALGLLSHRQLLPALMSDRAAGCLRLLVWRGRRERLMHWHALALGAEGAREAEARTDRSKLADGLGGRGWHCAWSERCGRAVIHQRACMVHAPCAVGCGCPTGASGGPACSARSVTSHLARTPDDPRLATSRVPGHACPPQCPHARVPPASAAGLREGDTLTLERLDPRMMHLNRSGSHAATELAWSGLARVLRL
jgi:hypothetical protein